MSNPFYTVGGVPAAQARGASSTVRNEYLAVQNAFDALNAALILKGAIGGQAWTGTHDYTGAVMRVATPVGVTDAVTKQYVDGLAFSTALPAQSGNTGKVITTNGTTASWVAFDGRGRTFLDHTNSGTTAQACDYTVAEVHRITVTGIFALTVTNLPAGRAAELRLDLVNGGAFAFTWGTTVNWQKADKTFTTSFAASGYTLQVAGTDFIVLWNSGTTLYGKVI